MKKRLLWSAGLLAALPLGASAQLVINEVSQGSSGSKEYIELVVTGTRTCTDSTADLRGWIVDDNGGWFGTSAISDGCYRFANVPSWSAVPYGAIILLYNNADKNGLITQPDDLTDANNDKVYIVPINAGVIELNPTAPTGASGAAFSYPATGFGPSTGWTPMALNNSGDAVTVVNPAVPGSPFHAMTFGNVSGGSMPNVHLSASGGQRNFYVTGSQYAAAAGWTSGTAPADETPGAPNTTANAAWINAMRLPGPGGGGSHTINATSCQGQPYLYNGTSYTSSGSYTILFPKPGGCDSTVTLNLTVNPVPAAPAVASPLNLCSGTPATTLTATGQNLSWYASAGATSPLPAAPVPGTSAAGTTTYYVSQTVSGCESPRAAISVIVSQTPAAPAVTSPLNYCRDALRIDNLSLGNGLRYAWSFGDGRTDTTAAPQHVYTGAGAYQLQLIATNDLGCPDTAVKTIVVLPFAELSFSLRDSILCQGESFSLLDLSITPGYQQLSWDFGDGFQSSEGEMPGHAYDTSGHFLITALAAYDGCPERRYSREVRVNPIPLVALGADTTLCPGGAPIRLQNPVFDPRARYEWSTGDTGTSRLTARIPATYWLQASIGNCTASDTMEVFKSCYIDVPNAFTPNGDGENDYFLPRQLLSRQLQSFHMQVFSRWGQLIFETKSTDGRGWDGRLNGEPQPAGVYIYTLSAEFDNGGQERYQGNVTLLR